MRIRIAMISPVYPVQHFPDIFDQVSRACRNFSKMETLLACCLHEKDHESLIYIPRFAHRLSLIKQFQIEEGKRILDIGCGQGESCLVMAMEVGDSGHVTGVDIEELEYGTPFNIGQSQEYIRNSSLGPRINFVQSDTASFLQSPDQPPSAMFDAASMIHSLWYFPTADSVCSLFQTLATAKIPRVYIVEYSFESSEPSQVPHVLAAQTQALFHAYKTTREKGVYELNVRAAPNPASIIEAAKKAGFDVHRQGIVSPDKSMLEGHFEARYVSRDGFKKRVLSANLLPEQESEILELSMRVKKEIEKLNSSGIEHVRAMDVWWSVLDLTP